MIGIGVILFNPESTRLEANIAGIYQKNTEIILVDNGSENISEIEELLKKYPLIHFIKNEKNFGIAYALNQVFEYFQEISVDWVLTLDQDSICPNNLLPEFLKYVDDEETGIICPCLDYGVVKDNCDFEGREYRYVEQCISSASLVNVEAWKRIGGFDEKFFIDFVDFDFCYRIRQAGYKIVQVKKVVLNHQLGKMVVKKLFGREIRVTNHAIFRKYYYVRNSIYCHKKNREYYKTKNMCRDIINSYVKLLLYEKEKLKKIQAMNKGVVDGVKYKCEVKKND